MSQGMLDELKRKFAGKEITYEKRFERGSEVSGTMLILESNIRFRVAFKNVTSDMYATVEFTNHNGDVIKLDYAPEDFTMSKTTGIIDIDALVIADARQEFVITVYNADGSVADVSYESIENYCAMANVAGLPVKLIAYADSAYAWLHK